MRLFIGIDPGRTGAIGAVDAGGGWQGVWDMPENAADLTDLLRERCELGNGLATAVAVEYQQPMPKQGVVSVFSLGMQYGTILGVLAALRASYAVVRPSAWKKEMGLTSDKADSRALARQLWPEAPLGRVKDHGRAEALLIAEWRRRRP